MAMCIAAGEQKEAEKRTQRRKYWVSPYFKERSFKSRYASDVSYIVEKYRNTLAPMSIFFYFKVSELG